MNTQETFLHETKDHTSSFMYLKKKKLIKQTLRDSDYVGR